MPLKFGILLMQERPVGDLLRWAIRFEDAGVDSLWIADHLAQDGSNSTSDRCVIEVDTDDGGHAVEVHIGSQQRCPMPLRHRGDHAVDHPTGGDARSTTASIDSGGSIKVGGGIELEERESEQKATQIGFTIIGSGPSDHLHNHRRGHGDWALGRDQIR